MLMTANVKKCKWRVIQCDLMHWALAMLQLQFAMPRHLLDSRSYQHHSLCCWLREVERKPFLITGYLAYSREDLLVTYNTYTCTHLHTRSQQIERKFKRVYRCSSVIYQLLFRLLYLYYIVYHSTLSQNLEMANNSILVSYQKDHKVSYSNRCNSILLYVFFLPSLYVSHRIFCFFLSIIFIGKKRV